MNLDQSSILNMLLGELITLNRFKPVWQGNPVMVTAVNSLQSKTDTLTAMDIAQKNTTKGITQTKEQARTSMINLGYGHVMAGRAYATSINDLTLKETLNYSHSDLIRAKDTDAYDICQIIHDALVPVISNMANYGATATTLLALQTANETFEAMISKPKSQKAIIVTATQNVKDLIIETRAINKNTLDPLMEQYKTSNTEFYKEYHASRRKDDPGYRTTTIIQGVITDGDNNPVEKALVIMRGTTKRKKTGANGKYKFFKVEPGAFIIEVSAQGYNSNTVKGNITENEVNKMNVQINKN